MFVQHGRLRSATSVRVYSSASPSTSSVCFMMSRARARLAATASLVPLEFAQHQHLLEMVMKLGGQPFALTLLGQVQFGRQRAEPGL